MMLLPRRYTDHQFERFIKLMLILKELENELLPDKEELYTIMSKPYSRKLEELMMNKTNSKGSEQ